MQDDGENLNIVPFHWGNHALHILDILLNSAGYLFMHIEVLPEKPWFEFGVDAKHIMHHQYLSVAIARLHRCLLWEWSGFQKPPLQVLREFFPVRCAKHPASCNSKASFFNFSASASSFARTVYVPNL